MRAMATLIADLLVPFADAGSLRVRDASPTFRKRIIVSLHFADAEQVHQALFPSDHLEWSTVREYLAETSTSTAEWVQLVMLFHFINEPPTRQGIPELLTAAAAGGRVITQGKNLTPLESLRLCFARAGVAPAWDTLCKAFVLSNIADIDIAAALLSLLTQSPRLSCLPGSITGAAAIQSATGLPVIVDTVVKNLPACKHSREDYNRTFVQLLSLDGCHVAAHAIMASIRAREENLERIRQNALSVLRSTKKPSLTRILEEKEAITESNTANHGAPAAADHGNNTNNDDDSNAARGIRPYPQHPNSSGTDSFRAFCHQARFPANMIARVKSACYFVAALPNLSQEGRLRAYQLLLGEENAGGMPHVLAHISIVFPETGFLRAFVLDSPYVGSPCATLKLFKQACIPATARGMNWTTIFRLYLAAHCVPAVCKALWEQLLIEPIPLRARAAGASNAGGGNASTSSGTSSSSYGDKVDGETAQSVQRFTRSRPFAVEEIAPLLSVN